MFAVICIVCLLVLAGGAWSLWKLAKNSACDADPLWIMALLVWCVLGLMALPFVVATLSACDGGLMRNYSNGIRSGYVTKISDCGIIWKTTEAQIQVGTGQQAALQQPWSFSIPRDKPELYIKLRSNLNKRVTVHYVQWLIMPYRIGDSGYEATKITTDNETE